MGGTEELQFDDIGRGEPLKEDVEGTTLTQLEALERRVMALIEAEGPPPDDAEETPARLAELRNIQNIVAPYIILLVQMPGCISDAEIRAGISDIRRRINEMEKNPTFEGRHSRPPMPEQRYEEPSSTQPQTSSD